MPTEAGKTAARQAAWAAMTGRNWTQGDLAARAGADPATVSDFLAGKRWPRPATLGKIEAALELTPGALAGLGEDPVGQPSAPNAARLTDAELVAELTYRLTQLHRDLAETKEAVTREARREGARQAFLASIDEDSSEDLQHLEHEWTLLMFRASPDGGGWSAEDEARYEDLCDQIDALVWARTEAAAAAGERESVARTPGSSRKRMPLPAPRGSASVSELSPKHQAMVEESMFVDEAAYNGGRRDPEFEKAKEARDAEARVGEENQDHGGTEPA